MCALAPDIGALRAACSAFLSECRCSLCGLPWRKASTFPCGHTFCYDCAIDSLEGPGISQSECPTCKGKFWKKDLKLNPLMEDVAQHARRILSVAEMHATASAAGDIGGNEAAADGNGAGNGIDCRGDAVAGSSHAAGDPADEGVPRLVEQVCAWAGAVVPEVNWEGSGAEARNLDPSRLPSLRPVSDTRLQHALTGATGADASIQQHHASANLPLTEAAAAVGGPLSPPLAAPGGAPGDSPDQRGAPLLPQAVALARAAGSSPLQGEMHRAGPVLAAVVSDALRLLQEGISTGTGGEVQAVVQASAATAVCGLGPGRGELRAVAMGASRGKGPEAAAVALRLLGGEQRCGAMAQLGRFAIPSAAAHGAAAAGLLDTPTNLQRLGLGRAAAGSGAAVHHASDVFLREPHGGGRHGGHYSAPSRSMQLVGSVTITPSDNAGPGVAAFVSHPLGAMTSRTMATPHAAQLGSEPRSQVGAGLLTLSNGRPAAGTGCGRQMPGSVVSIRRGTPSLNNAYLDFHALLEHPVSFAGQPCWPATGVLGGGSEAVCDGWGDFQEVSWLLRLAELPGPTDHERDALVHELSVVELFMEELQSMVADRQGGVVAVTMAHEVAAQELEAGAPDLRSGSASLADEGKAAAIESDACEIGAGGEGATPQQEGGAVGANADAPLGSGAPGTERQGQGAAPSTGPAVKQVPVLIIPRPTHMPPPHQREHEEVRQQRKPELPLSQSAAGGPVKAPVALAVMCYEAGAGFGSSGDAAACPAAGSHGGATAAGLPSNRYGGQVHHDGAGEAYIWAERQQPESGGAARVSQGHNGGDASAAAGLEALPLQPPACNLAPRRALDGGTAAGASEHDAGRLLRCKGAHMEIPGPGPVVVLRDSPPPPCLASRDGPDAKVGAEGAVQAATAAMVRRPRTFQWPGSLAAARTANVDRSREPRTDGEPVTDAAPDGGDDAAAPGCQEIAGHAGGEAVPGASLDASIRQEPHSPLRAPSPPPCPQREREEEEEEEGAGVQFNARRRRDRLQASKRHRAEPLQLPLEPMSCNPPAKVLPPVPEQQQEAPDVPAGGQRQARRVRARGRDSAAAAAAPVPAAELAASGLAATRRAKPLYVLSTTISPEERSRLKELTRRVRGLELLSDVQPQLTHLVVSLNSEGQVTGRTIKYMRAVIQGCWVVGMAWVDASLSAGRLLAEGPFEAEGDTVHPGTPAIARLRPERGDPPLFNGLRFCVMYLKGTFDGGITKPELEALLQAAGGTLVRRPVHRVAPTGGSTNNCAAAAPVTAAAALFGAVATSDVYGTTSSYAQHLTPQAPQEEKDADGTHLPPGMPPVFVLVTPEANLDAARIIREWRCAPIKTSWVYDCISHYKLLPPEAFRFGQEPHGSATDTS